MKKIAILISLKRSIEVHLHRLETFLLYFYDAYEVNLWEKCPAGGRLAHTEQMPFQNFIIF